MEDSAKPAQEMNFAPEGSKKEARRERDGSEPTHGMSERILDTLAFSWLWIVPCACVFGVLVILIYSIQLPSGVRWGAFCVGVVIGSAAFVIGGIVGFLFGIPRTLWSSTPSTGATQYQGNTNLEQVSDWLTKIIVGVSLVEIGRIIPAMAKLAAILKAPLGGQPSSAAFGLGVAISSAFTGFFFFYLWTRVEFIRELELGVPIFRQKRSRKATRRTDSSSTNRDPKS
jgi:hypothetical protein